MKTVLCVFAHPDDESFTCGGTIAKYAKAGWAIYLLCMTQGEAGDAGPFVGTSATDLASLRRRELEKAASIFGIKKVIPWDFHDGALSQLPPGELEERIYEVMVSISPDVVLTFGPDGITNHPDHGKVSLSTTFAFQKYVKGLLRLGDPIRHMKTRERNFTQAWQMSLETAGRSVGEPKLYYTALPESVATYLKKQNVIPAESHGKPFNGTPDKYITTVIAIKYVSFVKKQALMTHQTQQHDVERFLSIPSQPLLRDEYFVLRMQGEYEIFMGKTDRVSDRL